MLKRTLDHFSPPPPLAYYSHAVLMGDCELGRGGQKGCEVKGGASVHKWSGAVGGSGAWPGMDMLFLGFVVRQPVIHS